MVLTIVQVLKSQVWLLTTILNNTDIEYFHHCREFFLKVLFYEGRGRNREVNWRNKTCKPVEMMLSPTGMVVLEQPEVIRFSLFQFRKK